MSKIEDKEHTHVAERFDEIHALITENNTLIAQKRKEIHDSIEDFSSYGNLYKFVKETTVSPEEFNEVMGRMRTTYLDKKENENRKGVIKP